MQHRALTAPAATAVVLAASVCLGVALPAQAAPAPVATVTPSATATATPTTTPTTTPTASVTAAPTATPTVTPTASASATPSPTAVPTPTASASPIPIPTVVPIPTPTPMPTPVVPLPTAAAISITSGRTSTSRTVTLTGTNLTNLAGVTIGAVASPSVQLIDADTAQVVIPNAVNYQAGPVPISLTAASDGVSRVTGLTFTYLIRTRVDRQMAYAFQHWNDRQNAIFGWITGNDCANFASQTLLARGWKESAAWYDHGPGDWSLTWVSSTALSTWLKSRPDLATWLPYRDRDQVAVGDIVQFRWPGHPKSYHAWDHTAIVSKVVVLPDGRHDIYYVAHTNYSQYGGSTQYFATHMGKSLRIQFFHLK